MGATLSTADAVLKEVYLPGTREQLNNDIPFLNRVQKNSRDIEGRRAILAPHLARSGGVGARAEGGTLPTAGNQGWGEERITLNYNYGRIQISGPSIKAMKSNRGSFVRSVSAEMEHITNDLKRDVSRQLWGASDGKIATCGTTSSSTTVTLATATTPVQMRHFHTGMRVDIGTVANPTLRVAGATITSVDTTNETITIDSSVTTASTDFVFRAGACTANACAELTGMQSIVAGSGALFNLNPATAGQESWKSRVDSSVGSISENKMATHVMNVKIQSGLYPKLFIADDGSFRAYGNLLTSQKRSNNTQRLAGGYSGLSFDAAGEPMEVVWDMDTPEGCMFSVNPERLIEFSMSDWEWADEDGAVLSRVSGQDAYEAFIFKYHELATDQRAANGLMSGITVA